MWLQSPDPDSQWNQLSRLLHFYYGICRDALNSSRENAGLAGWWQLGQSLHLYFLCTGDAYYVPYSCLLISYKFCNGGPSRADKFLYAPAPPPPSVWALKPPSWALVHKTTYAPMIYTALCIMFWMHAYPLLGQVGGGGPGILEFFGPQMSLAHRLDGFSQGPKNSQIPGPNPLPLSLVMDMHAQKRNMFKGEI
jgi:hypothetical protein